MTINVTDVNEPPVKVGTPTVTQNSTTPKTKLDVSWTAPTMTGKPAVDDYDVQYRQTGTSTWSSHSFTGTGTSTTLSGLTSGKTYEVQVRAGNDEGNGAWSDSGSAITRAASVTRSVAENSAAGANVGAAVTAVSTNTSYTYTHALSGTDASKFEIGSTTGQITVKSGTSLDYETKTSYTVTVTVTAAAKTQGANAQSLDPNAPGDYVVPVTINVTDVNEDPTFSDDTATRSIAENSAANTNIGAVVTATDPDGVAKFNTLTYSLTGTDASKFNIGSGTGQITVKTGNIPNYEAKTSYSVTVNVTDGKAADGTADTTADDTIAVTISVTDVNEPPAAPTISVSTNSTTPESKIDVSWTAPSMTGKPAISDYDVQYRLSGDSSWTSHSFSGTGTSTTLTGLTSGKSYEVQVRAVNAEGNGAWSASGTAITDANAVSRDIAENSAAGTNVGAAVTASNTTYTYTHALSGTDASKFSINSSTGQITVGSGTSLDYESGTTSYSVVVTVTAAAKTQGANAQSIDPNAPGSYVIPVTINVTDVNEAPPAPDAPTVTQNTATPKTKLDVSWTALTTTQMAGKPAVTDYDVQYKKTSDTDWTEWNASDDGTTTSTTITGLTEGTKYEVQVRATNDEGDSAWSTSGKTNTQDKNVHAEFPDLTATRSIAENSAAGTNVGDPVTANDTENHTLYYSLNGTDKDEFEIGLNTGQITVKSGSIPDYEAKTSYSLTVEVSDRKDKDDNPDTKIDDTITVTINVTDVAEPPAAPAITVANNSTTPSTKIDVSWTAPDMTGKPKITDYDVQYRLSGVSTWTSHSFTGTGTSTTLTGLTKGKSYEVQVRAVNAEGNGAWSASGSAITDANAVSRSIAENSAAGTAIGDPVTASNTTYTYSHALSGTDAGKFEIGSSTGQITVKSGNIPNYEAKPSYSVIVTVTAAAKSQGANAQSVDPNAPGDYVVPVTINVTDVNEPPDPPAAPTVKSTGDSDNTTLNVEWTAPDMTGKPPITDYDVQYQKKGDSDWTDHSFTGAGTSTTISGQVGGVNYNVQVRATNDEGTSGWSAIGSLPNVDPKLPASPSRSIAENSSGGSKVGTAVSATDPDSSTLEYTLSGTDADKFEIDGSTGQITLADKTSPDYEAKTSYSVKVSVSDKKDSENNTNSEIDHTVTVTINVTNVKEPLGKPGTPTAKNATTSTITVTWTEPDDTGKPPVKKYWVRYWEKGSDYLSAWTVYTNEALIDEAPTALHPSAPLKPGTAYEVEVMAENYDGSVVYGAWSTLATLYTTQIYRNPSPPTNSPPATPAPTPTPTPRAHGNTGSHGDTRAHGHPGSHSETCTGSYGHARTHRHPKARADGNTGTNGDTRAGSYGHSGVRARGRAAANAHSHPDAHADGHPNAYVHACAHCHPDGRPVHAVRHQHGRRGREPELAGPDGPALPLAGRRPGRNTLDGGRSALDDNPGRRRGFGNAVGGPGDGGGVGADSPAPVHSLLPPPEEEAGRERGRGIKKIRRSR